jgi:hypothetical protein
MPQKTAGKKGRDQVRLPAPVVLKPPVTLEDLKTDTEYDRGGAEESVALIRALRKEGSRPADAWIAAAALPSNVLSEPMTPAIMGCRESDDSYDLSGNRLVRK